MPPVPCWERKASSNADAPQPSVARLASSAGVALSEGIPPESPPSVDAAFAASVVSALSFSM
eukprot:30472-Pelagococcus_subviridis.AAC.6